MFGIKLSQGTIVNFNKGCHDALRPIENNIKNSITNDADAIHFDETGIYIDKKRQWLHVASNYKYTYYQAHEKRGQKAIDEIDLNWNTVNALTLDKIEAFEKRYTQILEDGFKENYIANNETYAKKKVKKSTSLNLLNRLSAYKNEILSFMYNFDIPFDNNLAERDLRMTKVKQKISGTFRSLDGANAFTRIRGYVSTVRKNGLNTLDCIRSIFTSNPIDPILVY